MQLNQNPSEIDLEKRSMILRDFQSGLTYSQAKKNIEINFGDCVGYGLRTCDRWFRKFKSADFDLTIKPRDKPRKPTKKKTKKSTKTVKVNEVQFRQQELPTKTTMDIEANASVQKLIKSKPELTITKVPAKSSAAVRKMPLDTPKPSKAIPTRTMPNLSSSNISKNTDEGPLDMPKLRPRRPRSKGIEIQLPVSSAKRMNAQTLTENHSIGEGAKGSTRTEVEYTKNTASEYPVSRAVTVQFQNLNPEVAKSTVRKYTQSPNKRQTSAYLKPQNSMLKIANVAHVERMSPEKNKTYEQTIAPAVQNKQTSPLTNQKGIIYLNPQEIFRKSFGGFENSPKRPSPYGKPAQQTHTSSPAVQPQPRITLPPPPSVRQDSPIVFESDDSEEDVVFPENISLPAPKLKADPTYTTYWDMESCKLIQLNPADPVLPQPAIPVIEID